MTAWGGAGDGAEAQAADKRDQAGGGTGDKYQTHEKDKRKI